MRYSIILFFVFGLLSVSPALLGTQAFASDANVAVGTSSQMTAARISYSINMDDRAGNVALVHFQAVMVVDTPYQQTYKYLDSLRNAITAQISDSAAAHPSSPGQYDSANTPHSFVYRDQYASFAARTTTISFSVLTTVISSNATTLDTSHVYYIIPSNGGTAVTITPPTGSAGKVIIVENQDASATTTGLAVPPGSAYMFIYNGTAWKHTS